MCSIAGSTSREGVEKMLSIMKHRAPDDSGIFQDERYAIGMGRLKILDLASPNLCPIIDEKLILTFNGEIYNYIELREELKKLGHEFKTESDSEVLLKSYKQWGIGCLTRFNGMFAFAIYDGKKVFLARDLAGEKPLYYTEEPFQFASEAKSLNFDCKEFPPASYGFYDLETKELKIYTWWQPSTKLTTLSYEQAVEELDRLLASSVQLRTRTHVPYALYFSGGIDSTLISTYHDFEKLEYHDGDYQEEFKRDFPKILWHLDYPIDSFSPFGLWKLAQEAKQKGYKVVLSGEGADELFGGYIRYVPNEFNRLAQKKFPSYTKLFPYKDMLSEEFNGNMRELLRMGDRMAGAHGIENRCPFLDKRIIEFANSLPMEWKIKGYDTKIILTDLLKRRKPDYVVQEKKGLYTSANAWLGEEDNFSKTTYRAYQERIWSTFT